MKRKEFKNILGVIFKINISAAVLVFVLGGFSEEDCRIFWLLGKRRRRSAAPL